MNKESDRMAESPEVLYEEFVSWYRSVPVYQHIDMGDNTFEEDVYWRDKFTKGIELHQEQVERRNRSELKTILEKRLTNILSKSQLTTVAQELLIIKFDKFYTIGRPAEGKDTEDPGYFEIAIDTTINPTGIFSLEGAMAVEKEMYEREELVIIDEEESTPQSNETLDRQIDLELKKQFLAQWRESFQAKHGTLPYHEDDNE